MAWSKGSVKVKQTRKISKLIFSVSFVYLSFVLKIKILVFLSKITLSLKSDGLEVNGRQVKGSNWPLRSLSVQYCHVCRSLLAVR